MEEISEKEKLDKEVRLGVVYEIAGAVALGYFYHTKNTWKRLLPRMN